MATSKHLHISECDIEIFRKLSQYYLTAKMIYGLLPSFGHKAKIKSFSVLQQRLRRLYTEGYINRDQRLSRGQGVNQYYYFLTKKGANFFEDLKPLKPAHGILKRLELGSQEHGFMISDFMVKLEQDVWKSRGQVKITSFIRENYFEISLPKQSKHDQARYLRPDGTLFLSQGKDNQLLFLEIDLSTQPVFATNPYRSSFRKKIEVYSLFKKHFKNHLLVKLFGPLAGYRVITVCRSEERVNSLLDAAHTMGKEKMFWFTDLARAEQKNILFDPIWKLPNGSHESLFSPA